MKLASKYILPAAVATACGLVVVANAQTTDCNPYTYVVQTAVLGPPTDAIADEGERPGLPPVLFGETCGYGVGTLFQVMRVGDESLTTSVTYATTDITARAGVNYVATSGTLIFHPHEVTKTVFVNCKKDPLSVGPKAFQLLLQGPGTQPPVTNGIGTIVYRQLPASTPPVLHVNGFAAIEGGPLDFFVSCEYPNPIIPVTVNYTTQDGTAHAGQDYTAKSGSLQVWCGGDDSNLIPLVPNLFVPPPVGNGQGILVTTIARAGAQGPRTVNLVLSGATNGAVIAPTTPAAIVDSAQ